MTLTSLKGGALWPDPQGDIAFGVPAVGTTFGEFALDGASDKIGFVFQAPKAGNIDTVIFRVGTLTSSGDVDVRLETVDAATGAPSGTLVAANTNVTVTTSAANTTHTATLTAAGTVVRGTYYAAVIAWTSGNRGIKRMTSTGIQSRGFAWQNRICYCREGPSGTYDGVDSGSRALRPVFGVRYSDASYEWIPGNFPISALTRSLFNNTSATRERGVALIPRVPMRVHGAFWLGAHASANFDIILATTDGTARATASVDKDLTTTYATGSNYGGQSAILFPAIFDLVAGTTYYLTKKPTSATDVSLFEVDIIDTATNATEALFNAGSDYELVTRDSGGTYTVDPDKRPIGMGLIVSHLGDDAGGGGAVPCSRPVIMW